MLNEGFVFVFLVCLPAFLFGGYVSARQSTFDTKTVLAWIGVVVSLFYGIIVSNLDLSTFEKLVAFATSGFSAGLGWRLVSPSRSTGGIGKSLATIEWKKLQQERTRKPDKPVRLPSTLDVNQLKETCQREQFFTFDLQRRLQWRTEGLRKDDASISNRLIACRKLSAAIADWNQMKSLIAICVVPGISFGGGLWLAGVPVPWWLLIPVATILLFAVFCAMHMYSTLIQPTPQDVVVDFENGVFNWKSSSGSHSRPLSDVQQFSVSLNGSPVSCNGAALIAHFPDDFDVAILETPRNINPDEALAKLIPFARVLAEAVGVAEQHAQFGRDHVADSYTKPWIPQELLLPKHVLAVIGSITGYYIVVFWSQS